MTIADCYASLARMLDYPAEKEGLLAADAAVGGFLGSRGVASPTTPFAAYVAGSTLAELQEEDVATFDFNPAAAPYLGHHLYGDNQKRVTYMIGLKGEFGRHGFVVGRNELPDHLVVILEFLAHLAREAREEVRRTFIAEQVLPGVERLCSGFATREHSPWRPAAEAVRIICAADCAVEANLTLPRQGGGDSLGLMQEPQAKKTSQEEVTSC